MKRKPTKVSLDPKSYLAFPIKLRNAETDFELAKATGFYWKKDNNLWLVTNWHNFSGFDLNTGLRMEGGKGSPTEVSVPILIQAKAHMQWKWSQIPLYKDNRPNWYMHPSRGQSIDVVAIKIGEDEDNSKLSAVNEYSWDSKFNLHVADEIFILGYPYGLTAGGNLPIWKRATLASEPDIDINDLPQMIVDTTTRKGMSGSPVISRKSGLDNLLQHDVITADTAMSQIWDFIGIYSGRYVSNEGEETQLGKVWKKGVIEEIIEGRCLDIEYYPDKSNINSGG